MTEETPDVGGLVAPLLADLPEGERPFVIAYVERVAAGRYRSWAAEVRSPDQRDRLLACAAREEEIASRVEALSPDAARIQRSFAQAHADLEAGYAALFAGRSLADQMRIQAKAERLGAATWRALSEGAEGIHREVLASCAPLEEESAEALEKLVREGV